MDTFTIRTDQGWETVRGHKLTEHFAAHRLKASEPWKVTHLPTGMIVGPLPETLAQARRMAEALEAVAVSWDGQSPRAVLDAVYGQPGAHEAVKAAFALAEGC